MAEVTRVNGGTFPHEQVGRDVEWLHLDIQFAAGDFTTTPGDPDSNLEIVMRAVEKWSTVTIQGDVDTDEEIMFGLEGIGIDVPAAADPLAITNAEKEAAIKADLESYAEITTATPLIKRLTDDGFAV